MTGFCSRRDVTLDRTFEPTQNWPKKWKAFIGSHNKKVQGNTHFRHSYIRRPMVSSASHSLFLGFLMVTRLLPDTPSLHPLMFLKCCERECLSLNDHSTSLNASDWATCSCLHQSPWPRESKAPNVQVWVACPFLTQVKHHTKYEGEWSLLGKLRYWEKADRMMDSKTKDIHHRCKIGYRILLRASAF